MIDWSAFCVRTDNEVTSCRDSLSAMTLRSMRTGTTTCARHGAQRHDGRCQPEGESRPGSDLRVKVPWRP